MSPVERLGQCRLALAGVDEHGHKIHPGMFDSGIISLAHGDGTRRPPAEALKAGADALMDPLRCSLDDYLFLQRFKPLEDRVSEMFSAGGIPAEAASNVCIECGTTRLFGAFLHCIAKPGDLFLAAPTYYHSLPDWCACFGVDLACVRTRSVDAYKLTASSLEAWYRENVETGRHRMPRGLFLFNPTQTGGIYTRDDLSEIARFVSSHDLVVLADHVFSGTEFPDSPPAAYLAAEGGMAKRVVTVGGVSKSHNLANIRIGWACGFGPYIDAMRRYSVSTIISVPRLNMIMALAALDVGIDYLRLNAQECAGRVELIGEMVSLWNEELVERGLVQARFEAVHRPLAGHSMLISCAPLKGQRWLGRVIRNSVDVTRFFLSQARVAVSPAFASGLDDCEIRICFGSAGLAKTYEFSADTELSAVASAVEERYASQGHGSLRRAPAIRGAISESPRERSEVFSHGRELIRDAMRSRMLPAIRRLLDGESCDAELEAEADS